MTKIWAEAFWKEPEHPTPAPGGKPLSASLVIPCVCLAAITIIIGLWSGPLLNLSERAAAQLLDPQSYIRAVLKP